jgi:hypothetical protein
MRTPGSSLLALEFEFREKALLSNEKRLEVPERRGGQTAALHQRLDALCAVRCGSCGGLLLGGMMLEALKPRHDPLEMPVCTKLDG